MPTATLFIVQQFEREERELVAGRSIAFKSAQEAVARADRDAEKFAGVVALTMGIDTDSGEIVDEPVVLAKHGEVASEFRGN